jgi:uncharacterized small protein (TIGR04563 family)
MSDKRHQALYFPTELLAELKAEAARQDRSLSWVLITAWRIAKKRIAEFNSVEK